MICFVKQLTDTLAFFLKMYILFRQAKKTNLLLCISPNLFFENLFFIL